MRRLLTNTLATVAVSLGLLAGCSRSGPPSLLLVTLDTTRADHLGAYGYARDTSPTLDALAAEGVLFERAFAHAPITLVSHTSILTGTFPTAHGVRDNGGFTAHGELESLAEMLSNRGYATGAFVSAFVLDSRFGLAQGFDEYDDSFTAEWSEDKLRDARIYNQMVTDRPADQTTSRAIAWLAEQGDEPFFLWVHYYDPHQRYAPPRPYDQLFFDSPYDGEIAFMDAEIARLFAAVRERGDWDRTLVTVTADHGEALGQHGEVTHAVLTYDSTLQVPLIIKPPAATPWTVSSVQATVSHVDLLPTIADILGFEPPAAVAGRSLLPLLTGGELPARAAYFENALVRFSFGWEAVFGLRADGWKYIHAPERELYDLEQDPGELYNLATSNGERSQELERLLFRTIADNPPLVTGDGEPQAMDAEILQKLAALGYVSGTGSSTAELNRRQPSGRRSPLSAAAYLADYYLANALAGGGRLREAADIFSNTLLPLDPENLSFLTSLANLERRLGRRERAFELYRRAQALAPDDASILVELGQLERDRDNDEAAGELLRAARQLAPQNLTAVYLLAALAADAGDSAQAITGYEEALAIDASHRDSLINLAIELARSDRLDEARTRLAAALAAAPFSPRAHYNLGLVELRAQKAEAAATAFRRALRYERPYPAASLGLATALIELADDQGARRELETLIAEAQQPAAVERAHALLATLEP